ncbi:MFS transporter [Amycolatopsis panacis]|uniref:MFS transporter n=1 Tax=Amycolatopsis panacis TaxID=2340917 RepID=A0A419I5K9_9PSEU|nr:MFS transporter [Amycolatopsis panacis]RJQ86229.1 MFS transporter [Amycolatopsis panacis]
MPPLVFLLSAAVFAQGTSEFVVSGLLGQVAAGTGVSVGTAGLLTSAFAAGMVVGAPLLATMAGSVPRRPALVALLGVFTAAHVVAALTTNFPLLLASRVLSAFANAGFLAVALAALPVFVPAAGLPRATAALLSGVTLACIVGVPAGTVLGQEFGWHAAFWAIAAVTALVAAVLPATRTRLDSPATGTVRHEWRVLGRTDLRTAVLLGILVNGATFAGFTYLGTMTSDGWVPVVLAGFGIGSFAGVTTAGRLGEKHRERLVVMGGAVLTVVWLAAYVAAHSLAGLLVFSILTGAAAFAVGSTLIGTIVATAAPRAPRIAGAIATTAFNAGAVLGPALAGPVVAATDAKAALWVSAACTAAAALVARLRR